MRSFITALSRPSFHTLPNCNYSTRIYHTRQGIKTLASLPRTLQDVLAQPTSSDSIQVKGWIKTVRIQKNVAFVHIHDGTCPSSLQVVLPVEQGKELKLGSSVCMTGYLVPSQGKRQAMELQASSCEIVSGIADDKYPLAKTSFKFDYLRDYPHLRSRTNTFVSMWRLRHAATQAFHRYYQASCWLLDIHPQSLYFTHIHAPILTHSDCEGGGDAFQVVAPSDTPTKPLFFGRHVYLSVSAQLHLEAMAASMARVYTLGPTFRAEPSHSTRHLAEFWMLEAEMAFIESLDPLLDVIEQSIQSSIDMLLKEHQSDVEQVTRGFLFGHHSNHLDQLQSMIETPFERMTYTEAIRILQESKKKFEFPVKWGVSLQSEHERYLCEKVVKKPVFITHYPSQVKPFYMKQDEGRGTVACTDLLVPGVGELVGGSLREDRLDLLVNAMQSRKMDPTSPEYQWYLDLRKYGSVPHGGFGLGLERFLQMVTGAPTVKDTLPFPRVAGKCV